MSSDHEGLSGFGDNDRTKAGFRGVDGSGDPHGTMSWSEAPAEAELDRLDHLASQLAATLVGLAVEDAAGVVGCHAELFVRFVPEGQGVSEEHGYGLITASTRDDVVTKARAG